MTEDNKRRNLAVEVEKGEASLRAAELCAAAGLHDDAVSRAYYAAFHYVLALLFTAGLEPRSHGGVHDLLYLHFVRPGHVPPHIAKLFAALQKFREQADYARAFHFDAEGAREEVEHAREICRFVRDTLAAGGWLPTPTG